jgi:two-component system, cell cycle sensor histidine kinase and response regulator CckA
MSEELRILIVEDNPADTDIIQEMLPATGSVSFQVESVPRLSEALTRLKSKGIDLVLLDLGLPDSQGLQTLHKLRDAAPGVPVIVLTGTNDHEMAVRAVRDGAQDYLVKGQLQGHLLVLAARYALERKRADVTLQESELQYRTLADSGQALIWASGLDKKCNYFNRPWLTFTGRTLEQELGDGWAEGVHPDDLARCLEIYTGAFDRRERFSRDYRLRHQDGEFRWIQDDGTPRYDRQGNFLGFIGHCLDITGRKQAEARLDCFARLGRLLITATAPQLAARIMAEAASDLLSWDACYLTLGSPESRTVTQLIDVDTINGQRVVAPIPEAASRPTPMFRRVLTEGAQLIRRQRPEEANPQLVPSGDLTRRSLSLMFVPVRQEGKPIGVFSVQSYRPGAYTACDLETLQALADYGAVALVRLQAAAALRESEAHLAEAQRLAHLGSWVTEIHNLDDLSQNPLRWSDEVFRIFGYEPGAFAVTRDRFSQAVHPDDRARVSAAVQQALRERRPYEIEHRIVWPDGTERVVQEHAGIVFDQATGQPGKFVGTVQDITERKRLETQLLQAQKMEAVGQLAGGLAHDFNNMLAVVLGNAELLLMEPEQLGQETRKCLSQIAGAAQRAANLTRQLLIFSRDHAVQFQPVELNALIKDLAKMLQRTIREDIELECLYAEKLPFTQADPGMLERVLVNLVVNARDAMPHGGQLRIATERVRLDEGGTSSHPEARAGEFVCLTVRDTGTGIAPEHLLHIFEPFFTTKGLDKGTGLGLATVYGIAKQHQGWVEVSSRVGAGTTFSLFLPAIAPPAHAPSAPEPEVRLRGGTETILLVEDDFAVRKITRRVLETFKYKVCEASCAREALEVWAQHAEEIALLLTDIVMPEGVTGRDLAEQLRAQRPGLKVIFMSGYSAEGQGKVTEFFRKTKRYFLRKPCSTNTIIRTVRQCLDEA